jgi:hypothetical protein
VSDEADDVMAGERFIRQVGRRQRPPRSTATTLGQPPSPAARAALSQMAQYRTRVPKGIFIYASHEAANRDWERWQLEAMQVNSLVPRDE